LTVPSGGVTCETCGRRVFKTGVVATIEAAVNPDRKSEIVDELAEMNSSPDKRLRERYQDIMERFSLFSAYGQLEIPDEMRELRGALWEFKTSEDRVPFYRRSVNGHRLAARVMFVFAKSGGKTAQGKAPRWVFDRGEWYMKGDQGIGKINTPEITSA
jgi:hypothetical protein